MSYYKYDFEALNNLDMLRVVEKLDIPVKTTGRTHSIKCIAHDDKHPSMVVYDHHVKCYACGASFGVINFVKEAKNMEFLQACEWLASEFNAGREWIDTSKDGKCSKEKKTIKKKSNLNDLQSIINKSIGNLSRMSPPPPMDRGGESDKEMIFAFNIEYLVKHLSMNDSFCKCLSKLFDAELVRYVAEMYGIGCWAVDDTMFPVIDKDLNVHNIKIQHYDTNIFSETFFHKDKGAAWWYAKKYIETHKDIPGTRNDVNCYFGEHLISRYPNATIVLVESPKNAVLGTCQWPQYVWVATGNKGMLNRERLESLRGRKVIVMPDADAAEEWRDTLSKMQDIATFVISEMVDEFRKIGPKADVGDWIIKEKFKLTEIKG